MPWEQSYGYAQAVRVGDTIWVSGQLSHDNEGNIVGPAPVDAQGRILDHGNMRIQMAQCYANARKVARAVRRHAGQRSRGSPIHDRGGRGQGGSVRRAPGRGEHYPRHAAPRIPEHGEDDQIVRVKDSAKKSAGLIKGAKEIYYPGAPHGLTATHQDQVNRDLLVFLGS
jgi:pimeloyl-ACP methyl ester carboxylesterase